MATPTIRGYPNIIVALIAKLSFVRMTIQTGVLKAGGKLFSAQTQIFPIALPDRFIPPLIQQLHVVVPHELFGLDTRPFFQRHFLDDRGIKLRLRRRDRLTQITP